MAGASANYRRSYASRRGPNELRELSALRDGLCPSGSSTLLSERARAKLARPSTMREKAWVHAFFTGKMPDEAAYQANVYYSNWRVRAKH